MPDTNNTFLKELSLREGGELPLIFYLAQIPRILNDLENLSARRRAGDMRGAQISRQILPSQPSGRVPSSFTLTPYTPPPLLSLPTSSVARVSLQPPNIFAQLCARTSPVHRASPPDAV